MAIEGHQERFPPTNLSADCGFKKETIAGMCRNGRGATIPVVRGAMEFRDHPAEIPTTGRDMAVMSLCAPER
jgi:hypothetical protein